MNYQVVTQMNAVCPAEEDSCSVAVRTVNATFSLLKKGYNIHSTKSENVTKATIYCACKNSTKNSHGITVELVI